MDSLKGGFQSNFNGLSNMVSEQENATKNNSLIFAPIPLNIFLNIRIVGPSNYCFSI